MRKLKLCKTSKQRQNLRKSIRIAAEIDKLRKAGSSCANCSCFEPDYATITGVIVPICELYSDFHGYVKTSPTSICVRWTHNGR